MTNHKEIFLKIKQLLEAHFSVRLEVYENGNFLTINPKKEDESDVWIAYDVNNGGLTVGYGFSQKHYSPDHDNLEDGFNRFLNFLIGKKRRTNYKKDSYLYKSKYEFETEGGAFEVYGKPVRWLFPFWKKTIQEVTYQNEGLFSPQIKEEIKAIRANLL
jgi:hypothetical protein